MADRAGVSLDDLVPSHSVGRITRADVIAATAPTVPATAEQGATPLGPIRRVIVQRMTESARTVAPVTLTTDADASELVVIRRHLSEEMAETGDPVPTYTDLIVRLVALALREHPALNATLTDTGIVEHEGVHIGIAVDTDRGLLVPVVRDAHRKSIHEIASASSRLVVQTRDGTIGAADLNGGTFTVTNLGGLDIDAFTPIVNLPECAILGLGRIVARAVVIDEEAGSVAARKMIALSLTFDHRLVDGAPAARFLQRVRRMIECPYAWLTR